MRFLSFEANGQAGIGWVKDIHANDFVNLTLAAPELDRKSTRLNSSHEWISRMPSSA